MKKMTKKLSFKAETIRVLTSDEMRSAAGGSLGGGTSVISVSGTSGTTIINPGGTVMTIGTSGTSVISRNPSGGSH